MKKLLFLIIVWALGTEAIAQNPVDASPLHVDTVKPYDPGDSIDVEPVVRFADDVIFNSVGSITIPRGTTAQRPGTPSFAMIRGNLTTGKTEVYEGGEWKDIVTSGIDLSDPGADRLLGWDDSEGDLGYFDLSSGLSFSATTLTLHPSLQSISGLTTVADRMIYTTASDTYAVTPLTSFARTLIDDADAATARATLDVDQAGPDCTNLELAIVADPIDGTITCSQVSITLTAVSNEPVGYQWTGSSSGSLGTSNQITVSFLETITLSTPDCANTAQIVIGFDLSSPSIAVEQIRTIGGTSLRARAENENTFFYWSSAEFTDYPQGASIMITDAGTYNVTAISEDNGCSTSSAVVVTQDALDTADYVTFSDTLDLIATKYQIDTLKSYVDGEISSSGDVTGPASSTDNAFVRFDGTTGKLIQNSGATLSDAGLAAFTNVEVGGSPVVVDSDIGVNVQAWDAQLDDISGLAVGDGNIIVGDGTNWVAESGATARTSLGAGDVNGSDSSTDNTIARFDGTSGKLIQGSSVTILDNGNVGIGATGPSSILEVYQNDAGVSTANGMTIEQDGTGDAILQYLLTGTRRWVTGIDNSDSDKFKISPVIDLANGVFTIQTDGNVGIGTTSPGSKLEVDGSLTAGAITSTALTGTGTRLMNTTSGGAVGDITNGTDGQVMTMVSGSPAWSSASASSGGTYTPTVTSSSNVAATTVRTFFWLRNGDVVTVNGEIEVDITTAGLWSFQIDLPVSSNLVNNYDVSGSISYYVDGNQGIINANTTNNTAAITANNVNENNIRMQFQFAYEVK